MWCIANHLTFLVVSIVTLIIYLPSAAILLDFRKETSLGYILGQVLFRYQLMRERTFTLGLLPPSGPASHYSHHSQSPSDIVMRKMRHGGRRSLKYYISHPTPTCMPLPRDNFILLFVIFLIILLNFCKSFIKSRTGNCLSLLNFRIWYHVKITRFLAPVLCSLNKKSCVQPLKMMSRKGVYQ